MSNLSQNGKQFERCPECDKPLEPCGACPQCGEYPDSPCHKAYLAWDGWNSPSPMWDTFRAGWQAALVSNPVSKPLVQQTLGTCGAFAHKHALHPRSEFCNQWTPSTFLSPK